MNSNFHLNSPFLTGVLHRATVWFSNGFCYFPACGEISQRSTDIIFGLGDIGFVGRRDAVNAAFVNQHALRIDYKKLRRIGCAIEPAD